MIKVTVMVPVDSTNFNQVSEELRIAGMNIERIEDDLGVIHGRIHHDKIRNVVKLDSVSFVTHRI